MKLIKNQWEVKPISKNQTRTFVQQWHYAQGMGAVATNCFGLYYKGDSITLHGISLWNPPAIGAAKSVSSYHQGVLSLSRFCLRDDRPENAGSFLISKSINMLDNKYPMLLTYADTALNHDGGLYRAANWNYDGLTGKNPLWWDPINDCQVSKKSGAKNYSKQDMFKRGMELRGHFAKHRYLYTRTNRKNLIVNSRQTDSLIFTKDGKIVR